MCFFFKRFIRLLSVKLYSIRISEPVIVNTDLLAILNIKYYFLFF